MSTKKQKLGLSGWAIACLLILSSHGASADVADEDSLANRLKEFNAPDVAPKKVVAQEKTAVKKKRATTSKVKLTKKRRRFKRACYQSSASTLRDRANSFQPYIKNSSERYGVSEALIISVITAESCFHQHARSPKNARGLMQLIPATAKRFGVSNAYVASQNIKGGTRYLKFLLKRFSGDLHLVAAAYNAGEGAVDRYSGIPPYKETKEYVRRVMMVYRRLQPAKDATRLVSRPSAIDNAIRTSNKQPVRRTTANLRMAKSSSGRGYFIKPDFQWKRKNAQKRVTGLYKVASTRKRMSCRDVSSQKLRRTSYLVERGSSMKRYHTPVRPRSLSSIAKTTGVSLNMLLRMNRNASKYMVQAGSKILVWQCAGK